MIASSVKPKIPALALSTAMFFAPASKCIAEQTTQPPVGTVALPHITGQNAVNTSETFKYPENLRLQIPKTTSQATEFIDYVETSSYCHHTLNRIVTFFSNFIELDKRPGGLSKDNGDNAEDHKQSKALANEFLSILNATVELINTTKKTFPDKKFAIDDSTGKLLAAFLVSLDDNNRELWQKDRNNPTAPSEGGKQLQKVVDAIKENLLNADAPLRQFVPANETQPLVQMAIKWSDAVKMSKEGKISASMSDFFPVLLPDNGPTHAVISICSPLTINEKNWQNRICIVAGANIDQEFNYTLEPVPFLLSTIFIKLDNNNLIKIEQKGSELNFYKNSSGYGQFSVDGTVLGNGANTQLPVSNIYKKITDLELLAFIDNDWKRIVTEIELQKKYGNRTVSTELVQHALEPLTTGVGIDRKMIEKRFKDRIPTYIKLSDGSLLRISQEKDKISFARTQSGYASIGGGVYVMGVGGGTDVPVSHLYVSITASEAVAYFNNDWQPIYDKVAKQDRILPNSVSPSLLKQLF